MVRDMSTVPETLPTFLEFLGGPDTVLLAHNASFDLGFLGFAMAKLGMPSPPNPVVDTLDLSRTCLRELPYEGGTGGISERRITPRAMLRSGGRAYLTAYCHMAGIEKTYRLDRIREVGLKSRLSVDG